MTDMHQFPSKYLIWGKKILEYCISFCNTVIKEIDAYIILLWSVRVHCTVHEHRFCTVWYQNDPVETKFSFKGNLH